MSILGGGGVGQADNLENRGGQENSETSSSLSWNRNSAGEEEEAGGGDVVGRGPLPSGCIECGLPGLNELGLE